MATSGFSAVRRTGQVCTGLGALVVLVALLGGAPIALLTLAGNPLPDQLPTLAEIGTALTSRDDGQLFLRALAVVGWAGWATFALSVLVELPARATRRPAPRLPGLARQQRAAATLVGAIALIMLASPAANAAAAYAAPAPVVATAPHLGAPQLGGAQLTEARAAAPALGPGIPSGPAPRWLAGPTPADQPAPAYRVVHGDYLGQISARYLGDFERYDEVARLNKLPDPDRITPGQVLRLPTGATDHGRRVHATGRLTGPTRGAKPAPAPRPAPRPAPTAEQRTTPANPAPISAGASRAGGVNGLNRPLAVSSVLSVAGIVGAQIGAVLGLRRRPVTSRGGSGAIEGGRHRLFRD